MYIQVDLNTNVDTVQIYMVTFVLLGLTHHGVKNKTCTAVMKIF